MPRASKPWYDKIRKQWRVTIDRKRHTLGPRKAEATRRFHELMASRDQVEPGRVPKVGELAALYLRHLATRHRDGTLSATPLRNYRKWLGEAGLRWTDLPADKLARREVEAWVAEHATWNPTTRRHVLGALKSMLRWGVEEGLLPSDPLPHLKRPTALDRKGAILPPEVMAKVRAALSPPEAVEVLAFIAATGCRPGEACRLEARHVGEDGVIALAEHKTAGKTGRPRRIYPPPGQVEVLRRLMARHPEGPLFRNSRGQGWAPKGLYDAVRRAKRRAGVPTAYPYMLRHLFATNGLASGESPALMAELLGHNNLKTISGYSHLDQRAAELREAARRVGGGEGDA